MASFSLVYGTNMKYLKKIGSLTKKQFKRPVKKEVNNYLI
jgi:hypothetical protein